MRKSKEAKQNDIERKRLLQACAEYKRHTFVINVRLRADAVINSSEDARLTNMAADYWAESGLNREGW